MLQTLDKLQIGETAIVEEIKTEGSMRRRFLDIGLIPGSFITCILESPSKNPMAYEICGATIAIRKEDARGVTIKRVLF